MAAPGAFGAAMAAPGGAPQVRAPIMALLMCFIPIYGAFIYFPQMLKELKGVTNDNEFWIWGWLIPCYGIIWVLSKLPAQVTKAKQMRGVQKPTRSVIFYFFLTPFALAADLNEIADPNWTG